MNSAQLIYRGKLRLSFNIPFLDTSTPRTSARSSTRGSTRGSTCGSTCGSTRGSARNSTHVSARGSTCASTRGSTHASTRVSAHLRLIMQQLTRHMRVGSINKHCICMAFTSKIGARVVPWLPLPPVGPPLIKRFGQ
jgi:hypothetical protein